MFELGKKERSDSGADVIPSEDQPDDQIVTFRDSAGSAPETLHQEVTVIGRSIRINGDLYGDEDVRIEGDVTGTVRLKKNTLTIGLDGKIHADVYAKSVTVDGAMEGDLYGSECVSIRKSAQMRGNITAPRISLEDGARFKGSIEMDPEVAAAAFGESDIAKNKADKTKTVAAKTSRAAASTANGDKPVEKSEVASGKGTETTGSVAG